MAKDDYFVIAYKILSYLYACLKSCEEVDINYIQHDSKYLDIGESYWAYIIEHLIKDGYIEGISIKRSVNGCIHISNIENTRITPKGIEYLHTESMFEKAKRFLKDAKAIVPYF